ncbi:signal peptidase II [Kaistia dalseonensis]|uniref:Lipoprotein signal peptidase n=1 Tax=Kaistia dalseonensis TaxID=410840 RepID=A0ABU0HAC5_9HYPH|nr:signal peptidase II [Kaistia dalseonensis]MCX5496323.1 signal peptidase II [Kaistia dalseonensis]MDQ0438942.1 signal peptidase II [Kaistia dalseonensis]
MTASPAAGRVPGPLSRLGLGLVGFVVILDQITKQIAEAKLGYQEYIDILPILALYRVHNTGIAFSFAHGFDSLILVVGTAIVTLIVLYLWKSATEGGTLVAVGFALIVGGAVGNLIDRAIHGYVIDFLYLHIGGRGFFVFNLADVALTIGPVLLAWFYLFVQKKA